MNTTKIFLSSTFVDLEDSRTQIRRWLEGLFDLTLVVMEGFGSDSAPPDVNSVRRVREADIFVGIYGFRYGQVEPTSGRSITELELDEAEQLHSAGTIRQILLYKANEDASWLKHHSECEIDKQRLMAQLRRRISSHTYTSFSKQSDLIFAVVRDVSRVVQRTANVQLRVRGIQLPEQRPLRKPVGMEFLRSTDSNYLIGRSELAAELVNRLRGEPFVLLLGESGVGKTSIIHAALIPESVACGYRVIYTRPRGYPFTDVIQQMHAAVFEGHPPHLRSLRTALELALEVMPEKQLVLVIDQFEDVMAARDPEETERLIAELAILRSQPLDGLQILLSYRSDMEGRLGHHWQKISGSPLGLPRVYVGGIHVDSAWKGLIAELADLNVTVALSEESVQRIKADLLLASSTAGVDGVYPPYLQMLIEHMWHSAIESGNKYTVTAYQRVEGIDGVIGGYLSRILAYAKDALGHVRSVLVTLVKSYGVKAQRSILEIAGESGLTISECEMALEKLVDLRLIRHLGDEYEIAHDFIARKVASELVDSDQREYKRFRELLASKAAAYSTTQNSLTSEELLMLFKRRKALVPSDTEGRILTRSWLEGQGPALCWLIAAGNSKLLSWVGSEARRESGGDEERATALMIICAFLGHSIWDSVGTSVFRRYRKVIETTSALKLAPNLVPEKALRAAISVFSEVRKIAGGIVLSRIAKGEWLWLPILRNSSRRGHQALFMSAVIDTRVPEPPAAQQTTPAIREFALLKALINRQPTSEKELRGVRSLLGRALAIVIQAIHEQSFVETLRTTLRKGGNRFLLDALACAAPLVSSTNEGLGLLGLYQTYSEMEKEKPLQLLKIGQIISRLPERRVWPGYAARIRKLIRIAPLTPPLVEAAISRLGATDIYLLLERVRGADEELALSNTVELARQLECRLELIGKPFPQLLAKEIEKKEFWEYVSHAQRANAENVGQILQLKNSVNRPIYIRLLGHAAIGAATADDIGLLRRLTAHYFDSISKSAVLKLNALVGERVLDILAEEIDEHVRKGNAENLAQILRFAEMTVYGLVPGSLSKVFTQ